MYVEQEVSPTQAGHTGYRTDSSAEERVDPTTLAVCLDLWQEAPGTPAKR